ncbi:stress response protein NST1-like [Quillaja saponaria]|uniref:Stress response protein NST1-like n=1 Tax=Quillaja saponaria TaxID=32244 RepID=A0AAD7PKQ9_QUISA|nr:stress response protein NST1-like [Quillaja saponaria]
MVGGGSRRDEGSLVFNNSNVFAALETLRKKKKSDKEKKTKGSSNSQAHAKEPEPPVFWAPAPLTAKSWADVDDDDDDDYYATTAPLQSVWTGTESQQSKENPSNVEDSETEEDILDEGDDEGEEEQEHEHEHEPQVSVHPEPEVRKPTEVNVAPKEAERQLSKKERKKKELAELEALLADFGVSQKESNAQDESSGVPQEKKDAEHSGDVEKKENATAESKNPKKKKKKDKAAKEVKESQYQPNNADSSNGPDGVTGSEEDSSVVDVKERIKKVASMKKKKSSKEMDAAAKAAGQEAAARRAKLAAAKKKEKNHYNQQPVRNCSIRSYHFSYEV